MIEKTYIDYIDKVQEAFPELSKKQIDAILKTGLRSFVNHHRYGADTYIRSNFFTMYTGRLYQDIKKFFKYSIDKQHLKLRIKEKKKRELWDGYYYFALSEDDYQKYKSILKKNKRKREITFSYKMLYRIPEELLLEKWNKYIYRMHFSEYQGYQLFLKDFTVKDFELWGIREAPKSFNIKLVSDETRSK